jgi:Putative transposase
VEQYEVLDVNKQFSDPCSDFCERLCRYITHPAIAEQRWSLATNGNVIVELKSPYNDGSIKVIASIEEPAVIERLLKHLGLDTAIGPHNRSSPTDINGLSDQATTNLI